MFKIILASLLFCTPVLADPVSPATVPVAPPTPAIQYVGVIAINPSQDAKVLADWYKKLGVDFQLYEGGYYGMFKTPAGPFYFAIHPKKAHAAKRSSSSISVVFRVSDYTAYVSMVEKQGLKPLSVESDSTGHFAHYRDPDGNEMTIWGD